jgi:hypothetical protein
LAIKINTTNFMNLFFKILMTYYVKPLFFHLFLLLVTIIRPW